MVFQTGQFTGRTKQASHSRWKGTRRGQLKERFRETFAHVYCLNLSSK